MPAEEPIDLINVAFGQKPWDERAQATNRRKKNASRCPRETPRTSGVPLNYEVPDRLTGKSGLEELSRLNAHRQWRFVEVRHLKQPLINKWNYPKLVTRLIHFRGRGPEHGRAWKRGWHHTIRNCDVVSFQAYSARSHSIFTSVVLTNLNPFHSAQVNVDLEELKAMRCVWYIPSTGFVHTREVNSQYCPMKMNSSTISHQGWLILLTLSLLRVINVKFPLQPHQKYYITQ